MDVKKRTVILVIIALVLAVISITINLTAPEKVSTKPTELQVGAGAGDVGIEVIPYEGVEDKLAGDIIA